MTKKTIAIFLATIAGVTAASAKNPVVDDIAPYVFPANRPAAPANFVFMPDGASYLVVSPDRRGIDRFDTASGKLIEKYFDVTTTRENSIEGISGFVLSPDASKILVYNNDTPVYRRSFTAEYYVYEVKSRILSPLSQNHKRQRSPLFSPDSRMVAFVSDNNIHIKKIDYKSEVAVTTDGKINSIINGVSDWTYEEEFTTTCSMAWAPDNSTLCYIKYNETDVPAYTMPVYWSACDNNNEADLYPGSYTYKYPVAGEPNSRVSLHSYSVDNRKTTDITLSDKAIEYIPRIAYAPGSSLLIVATLNRDQNRLEIYSVNPRSTVVKSLYVEDSKAWIAPMTYEDIVLEADGFVINSSKSGYSCLYRYSYAGAELNRISAGDADITAYYGSDALGNRYYQAALPTPLDRTVCRLDRKGVVTTISKDKGWSTAVFAPGCDKAVLCHSDITTPPVYTLVGSNGKTIRTVEDNAAYRAAIPKNLPVKEFFTFDSDGVTLNGYMIRPVGASSAKAPVVMSQYSGPGSQSVVNRWSLDWDYYFAEHGYAVICVDGRGTGGRGRAFSDIVYKQLGHYETIDQINAARYAATLPFVDPSRIAVYGWSYGGYEALMCATADNSPYAAAVAIAPVTDWRFYDTVYAERYMLTPQQNFDGYAKSAPLRRAASLACPLLIMAGTADDNVHISNTYNFVSKLQLNGGICDMFIFPGMNHSIYGCNSRAVVYAKMLDFLNKNMVAGRR